MLGAAPQLTPAPGVAYVCGDCGECGERRGGDWGRCSTAALDGGCGGAPAARLPSPPCPVRGVRCLPSACRGVG